MSIVDEFRWSEGNEMSKINISFFLLKWIWWRIIFVNVVSFNDLMIIVFWMTVTNLFIVIELYFVYSWLWYISWMFVCLSVIVCSYICCVYFHMHDYLPAIPYDIDMWCYMWYNKIVAHDTYPILTTFTTI